MNIILKNIEKLIIPLAESLTPSGSDPRAVVHQWVHALCSNTSLVAGFESQKLIDCLRANGLYKDAKSFKKSIYEGINFPPPNSPRFKFIDLFAGIGGFRLALQKNNGVCVFSSEWDLAAQKTYFNNYGELPFGDITSLTSELVSDFELNNLIPDHDVLAGGFPCQPFSHAGVSARNAVGKEHGFKCETQGTLFFDIMRIASIKRPKVLFLENVSNIERHDGGRTFSIIKESIEELGYNFKYQVIDSSTLVPQRRRRCYMVCFRRDLNIDFLYPDFGGEPLPLSIILDPDPDPSFTISDKLWAGHIRRTQRNIDRGTGFTAHTANLDKPSNTLVARYGKDGKECLIPQGDANPRLLTPRECARLQGYPEKFIIAESRTPAYRQFGNSVAVPVVSRLADSIMGVMK